MKKNKSSKKKNTGLSKSLIRITAIVLVLCLGVLGIAMIPSLWKGEEEHTPEMITVVLKGDSVVVNKDKTFTLSQLRDYFDSLKEEGAMPAVAFVCDNANPPSEDFYGDVIALMEEYGISPDRGHIEKVKLSLETPDEAGATFDETV